uniref:GST N-terminal domain-containing protein n=1 Tax=Ditylum brightwellii TaxID=49249 RepID=A0A6U3SJ74_9STRA|mmetsp:Transcript_32923/g.49056  ORF Transcript_32923/g.49056 Transcript_32923/m.49056 type:complete len:560 (+) Transcript_32923:136-1815(+)
MRNQEIMWKRQYLCLEAVIALISLLLNNSLQATAFTTAGRSNRNSYNIESSTFITTSSKHVTVKPSSSILRMSVPTSIDTLTSGFASIARLPFGVTVSSPESSSPSLPRLLQLYDIENSRDCRMVRERITELDLEVDVVIPSAPNSRVFKDQMYKYHLSGSSSSNRGGVVPRLVVLENKGGSKGEEKVLIGTDEILSYLDEKFGERSSSMDTNQAEESPGLKDAFQDLLFDILSYVPSILRNGRGESVCNAALLTKKYTVPRPVEPLILYSYEGNQFCRLVREVLTELDIPYTLKSAGKLSPRRDELFNLTGGSTQCPFIVDPNTNVRMAESKDIIKYLYRNYALWTPPNELLRTVSDLIMTPIVSPLVRKLAPVQAKSSSQTGGENQVLYEQELEQVTQEIISEIESSNVVIYTYKLSPFCTETTTLLDNLNLPYQEISLGYEWIPGLISNDNGAMKREALNQLTGQSSLPNIFVNGKSIGGIFSGTPGLLPALEDGTFFDLVEKTEGDEIQKDGGSDSDDNKDDDTSKKIKAVTSSFAKSLGIAAAGNTGTMAEQQE